MRQTVAITFLASALASWAPAPFGAAAAEPEEATPVRASPVVVTATRIEQESFDLPLAIDAIGAQVLQEGRAAVNVSEGLTRVPGTVVQNRETFAQEQQIVLRGFGARSQFGVRGIRLYADGIPGSTPDGQGGAGLFDLDSAARIEVLRGPFSALYGNHSGGVVQVFTEEPPERAFVEPYVRFGSFDTWKAGLKLGGSWGDGGYLANGSRFETDGFRDWSGARKDQFNAKLTQALSGGGRLQLSLNALDQPDNLDPLGLTADEVRQNREQASPVALQFKTRRSLSNLQGGAVWEQPLSATDTLRLAAYLGQRSNEQFLAIPLATQNGLRHSGGVSVFDRDFGGASLRWTRRSEAFGTPFTLTAGLDYDRAQDDRKGFRNELGTQGALKRDEDNLSESWGGYLQGEWRATEALSLHGGLRYTRVDFESKDKFICTTTVNTTGTPLGTCSGSTLPVTATNFNPDDSGSRRFSAWTPVAGLLYRLSPAVNLYANAGRSFETPTFIEIAYRPDGSSGLNLALEPSKSNHYEVGVKAFLGADTLVNAALFQIDTRDEIVVFSNSGGRATFQNAGDTRRRGAELSLDSRLTRGLSAYLALTYLEARFQESFPTCAGFCTAPNATVAAGNRIPAVPEYTVYGEFLWEHRPLGLSAALEARWNAKVYVNDLNTDFAPSYFVASARAVFKQRFGDWLFQEFLRVDNLLDEEYIGAVIVGDANGRFFAPAPGRTLLVGVSVRHLF
ncbi:MAG: TonB-dependent receptor [Burkholderiales bacterium]|nr:MAG: TonB-dependent receptor [Burkholderiales bacterium]